MQLPQKTQAESGKGTLALITSVVQHGNWNVTAARLMAESSAAGRNVTVMPTQYYSQHTLYPTELWKVAATLSANEVSFPVRTTNGYAVCNPSSQSRRANLPIMNLCGMKYVSAS